MSEATRRIRPAEGNHVQNSVSLVNKKSSFEIDLRVEGASQDPISQDEAKINEVNENLDMFEMIMCKIRSYDFVER